MDYQYILNQQAPNVDLTWHDKKPLVYWRGNGNMHTYHNPRAAMVTMMNNYEHANVRFIRTRDTKE
ncbi:MAG TPA: hypothetical protein VLG50_08075 [Candidatus Saccharimonadales bacterium]|nr:hypothetical protein [Candidatus Saccharimonadales bacterium]